MSKTNATNNRLYIYWGDYLLDNISRHKHLGIVLDNRLLWSQHISTLIHKFNLGLNVLNCIKEFLPFSSRMRYFDAFIGSYISYASSVWGGAGSGYLNSLLITQKDVQDLFLMSMFLTHKDRYLRN